MATKIIVYTKNACPNCMRAKFMLQNCPVDVELVEINIDEVECNSKELYIEHLKTQRIMSMPSFVFEDGDIVVGFEEGKIMNKLGL